MQTEVGLTEQLRGTAADALRRFGRFRVTNEGGKAPLQYAEDKCNQSFTASAPTPC
jgi:hypothetical protein